MNAEDFNLNEIRNLIQVSKYVTSLQESMTGEKCVEVSLEEMDL